MSSPHAPVALAVAIALAAALALPSAAGAQPGQAGQESPAAERPERPSGPPEPKPSDKVITKDAKSDEGIFTVHRLKEKVYHEIPASALGKEFLWVSQIARTTLGAGHRRDAAVHHRSAGVVGAIAHPGPRLRPVARVRRSRGLVPREHRGRGDPHLHRAARERAVDDAGAPPLPFQPPAPRPGSYSCPPGSLRRPTRCARCSAAS